MLDPGSRTGMRTSFELNGCGSLSLNAMRFRPNTHSGLAHDIAKAACGIWILSMEALASFFGSKAGAIPVIIGLIHASSLRFLAYTLSGPETALTIEIALVFLTLNDEISLI